MEERQVDRIISMLTSPIVLAIGGGILLLLVLLKITQMLSKKANGGDFRDRVRELVEQGDFRAAAMLQRKHHNYKEAFNLLERGSHHMEAAKLAEGQGWYDKAAKCASQAGQFEWAAELHIRAKEPLEAAKLFARTGKFVRAAELLEQMGSTDWPLLAQCWEKALLQMLPSDQDIAQLRQDAIRQVYLAAEKAAGAYQKAGNPNRAAMIYEACQQQDKAATIRRSAEGLGGFGNDLFGSGMAETALGSPTTMTTTMGPQSGLDDQSLTLLSKVVDQAVQKAMSDAPARPTQVFVNQQPMTGGMPELHSASHPNQSQIQVIYIPDTNSNKTTAVRTQSERYEILEKLGEGGMAVVYKAIDKILEREVAMKFLPEGVTQAATMYELFEREAKSAAGINHPNIITIYDFGQLDGRPFICMELLDGISIDDLLQKMPNNRLPLNAFFEMFDELLSALEMAHGRGLVHRDIKPSNMMLTRQKILKLMDFGIAKEIDPDKSTMIAGTPYYMAPEQFSGKGIDHRVDIFAVGVTMYLCATGKLPFEGFMRIEPPRPPGEWARIPSSLDKVIMWCLAFEPNKRPQSAYDLLQNLRRIHREVRKDPLFAPQLKPSGQDAYIPLLGRDFFQEEKRGIASIHKQDYSSSATLAAYQSSTELPASRRPSHTVKPTHLSRTTSPSRSSYHEVPTTRATQMEPPRHSPRNPHHGIPTHRSPGLRNPSHPNVPRIRGKYPSQANVPNIRGTYASQSPSANPFDETMVAPTEKPTTRNPQEPRNTQRHPVRRREPNSIDDLLSGYIDPQKK